MSQLPNTQSSTQSSLAADFRSLARGRASTRARFELGLHARRHASIFCSHLAPEGALRPKDTVSLAATTLRSPIRRRASTTSAPLLARVLPSSLARPRACLDDRAPEAALRPVRRRPPPLRELLFSAGVTLVAGQGVAHAQTGTACTEQRLRIEGSLAPQWLEPVVRLCEALSAMEDVDPSAQLRVVGAGDDVIVEVTLQDGRSTLRRVHTPRELPLTVEALVAVPPLAVPPLARTSEGVLPRATPVPPHDSDGRTALGDVSPAPVVVARTPEARTAPARRMTLELGANLVGRIEGNPIYLSLGVTAYAGIRSGPWLLALTARWDGYQTVLDERPDDFEMTTAGGGFQVLRRLLAARKVALEGGLTAWMVGETQAFEHGLAERAGSIIDVRLGALTRAVFGSGPLRWTANVDSELSPARLQRELHVMHGLPKLPQWSVGVGGGVAWEGP